MSAFYWRFDGEAMQPLPQFAQKVREAFVPGQVYRLMEYDERSPDSHKQYFATIREGFINLPEDWAECFADETHLRKWLLIRCGFRNEKVVVCKTHAEALRTAAFVQEIDEYAVVIPSGLVVRFLHAKSQSYRAMGKAEFERSKTATLDLLAQMLEVSPEELEKAGRNAA
jgi:hypothetical protein